MNATLNGQKWRIVACFSCGGKGTMERSFLGDRKDLPPRATSGTATLQDVRRKGHAEKL